MLSFGLQSALAIRRQRLRAELMRNIERRRSSTPSVESSTSRNSKSTVSSYAGPTRIVKNNTRRENSRATVDSDVNWNIGVLEIGVGIALLGVTLMVCGVVFNGYVSTNPKYWNSQVFLSGMGFFAVGFVLIIIGQLCNRSDEDELATYVDRQTLKDNWNTILIFDSGTRGVYTATQKAAARQPDHPPRRNSRKPSLSKITEEECLIQLDDIILDAPIPNDPSQDRTKQIKPTRCCKVTEV